MWWYTTNLIAVCVFKSIHFASVYRQGLFAAAGIQSSGAVEHTINTALVFATDAFQVGVIVLIVFLIAKMLFRKSFNILMLLTTLMILFIGVGNALSLSELGSTLSLETLLLSIDWIRSDPSIITEYIGRRNILGAAILTGWYSIPFITARLEAHDGGGDSAQYLFWMYIFRIVMTVVILGSAAFAYRVFGIDGWWSLGLSIVAAFLAPRYLPFGTRLHYLNVAVKRFALGGAVFAFVVSGIFQLSQAISGPGSTAPMFDGYLPKAAKFLHLAPTTDYEGLSAVSTEELRSQYHALVYPGRDGSPPVDLIDLDPARLVPRHIVIVSLETAPMRYYRLFDDPALPNFYRLSRQAIVNKHHYSNIPYTTSAAASILSGLYAVPRNSDHRFEPDALPRVLGKHNYHTSYVDAFLIDWRSGAPLHRRLYKSMGFQSIVDATNIPGFDRWNTTFDYEARLEKEAIERVASTVLEAEAAGEKAMVFLQTALGHFPWNAPEGHAEDSSEDRLYGLVREYDSIIGLLIERLDEADLTNETIVVITGDHGLRYNGEFQSVGLQFAHSDVAFNVPLIISAPGLLRRQVGVPFVTSHVDLAPTLLTMVGISLDGMYHHGANILSGEPANRVTYMMNTRLSPVDGLHWNGLFFTYDALRDVTNLATDPIRSDAQAIDQAIAQGQLIPGPLVRLNAHLAEARHIFDLTIAHFFISREPIADE